MSRKKEGFLVEYIFHLAEGRATRELFERYREYLTASTPREVNFAIDKYIDTETDYYRIEKIVSQFIRACSKGLDAAGGVETEIPFILILNDENSRLKAHRVRTTVIYKKLVTALQLTGTADQGILTELRNNIATFNELKPHYAKLQNSLFPALEKYSENMNCLKLMWHIQDEIFKSLKMLIQIIDTVPFNFNEFNQLYGDMFLKMGSLIYREERILYPLAVSLVHEKALSILFSDIEELGTSFDVDINNFRRENEMSENLNNTKKRKDELNRIISVLNQAEDRSAAQKEIKKDFKKLLDTLSPEEVAEAEQALIAEGVPVEEVQKLCELHVDTFHDALQGASKRGGSGDEKISGHPVSNYKAENKALKAEITKFRKALKKLRRSADFNSYNEALDSLSKVEVHYARKENQLFPFLEEVGFTGPSKVMWGKHDEIRDMLKMLRKAAQEKNVSECIKTGKALVPKLKRMIFMEEKILFPTALRKLPEAAWSEIRNGEAEIGYAWIKPGNLWAPEVLTQTKNGEGEDFIDLSVGKLSASRIDLMLTNLPIDITYVDENDHVRYFSQGKERIFPRSPGIIGRSVQNCHPPKSVHIVQKIIDDFKAGERDIAEFWIQMEGKFIHIRYFPLFEGDRYKGVLEVSQEVSHIRSLEGEKRLLDEE